MKLEGDISMKKLLLCSCLVLLISSAAAMKKSDFIQNQNRNWCELAKTNRQNACRIDPNGFDCKMMKKIEFNQCKKQNFTPNNNKKSK